MMKKIVKLSLLLVFTVFIVFSLVNLFSDSEYTTKKIQDILSKEKYAQLSQEYLIAIQKGDVDFLHNHTDTEYINIESDLLSNEIIELTNTVDITSFVPYNLNSNIYSKSLKHIEFISEYSSTGDTPYATLITIFRESDSDLKVTGVSLVPQEKSLINTEPIIEQHDNPVMIYVIFGLGLISLIFAFFIFIKNKNISIWWLLFIILGNLFIFSVRGDEVFTLGFKFGTFVPEPNSQFYFIAPVGIIAYFISYFRKKKRSELLLSNDPVNED